MTRLERGEHSIFSYFDSREKAEEAAVKLVAAGFETIHIDRVSKFGVELDSESNNPVAGGAKTITGLTLFSADTSSTTDTDRRVLLSTDPAVSGMADTYDEVDMGPFLLLAVVSEGDVQEAVNIIKENGGKV